jgi:hypothetical protein
MKVTVVEGAPKDDGWRRAGDIEVGQYIEWDRWHEVTEVERLPEKPAWFNQYMPSGRYVAITWKPRTTPDYFHESEPIRIRV